MDGPPTSRSNLRRCHRRAERYTPDGTLGRLLFATIAGTGAFLSLSLSSIGFSSLGFGWFLAGFLAAGVGLAAVLLAVATLWPVYLSLIGNVESASAYPDRSASLPSDGRRDDLEARLKRKYARGDLSRAEFERRLDGLLGGDIDRPRQDDTDDPPDVDAAREQN